MFNINYTYKNLEDRDKSFLPEYLDEKIKRIDNLLGNYNLEDIRLEAKAEAFATKSAYRLELVLHLPGDVLRASEDDHTLSEAIDLSVDKLIAQLRKLSGKRQ